MKKEKEVLEKNDLVSKKIDCYLDLINKTWFYNLERLKNYYYRVINIENAYSMVYFEMCHLLKADIIVKEYKPLLEQMPKKDVLRHYHFYINNLWPIIKYHEISQLVPLQLAVSDLVIQYYKFMIVLHGLNSWH